MSKIEEKYFDKFVKNLGGRLDIHNLERPLSTIFEKIYDVVILCLSNRKEDPLFSKTDFKIHFDFIDNPQFNALTFRSGKTYYIGLYSGTVLILYDFMLELLSDHRIFQDIGNICKEDKEIVDFNNEIVLSCDYSFHKKNISRISPFTRIPKDKERAFFAMLLAEFAIYFIVFHELAHALFGHLNYLNSFTKLTEMRELGASYLKEISIKTLQTLEIDADCSAIAVFFYIADLNMVSKVKSKKLTSLWNSEGNFYWACSISINIIFRLLNYAGSKLDSHKYSTHPEPYLRFCFAQNSLKDFYAKYRMEEYSKVISGFLKANESCNLIWQLLRIPYGFTPFNNESEKEKILDDFSAELFRIRNQLIPLF